MKQELQTQINAMAATLAEQIEVNATASTIAADAYVKTLPEGITLETVQKIQDHNAVFFPAVTKAFGEKAIDAMKKDKKKAGAELDLNQGILIKPAAAKTSQSNT